MKDFGRWMADQAPAEVPCVPDECDFDNGLYLGVRGDWWGICGCCGGDYEIMCEPEEYDPENSYCGGSPGCCP
jgi:hypothetical protein